LSPTEIAEAARGWIGTPYRHAAALRGVGCDCLGLVRGLWSELGGAPLPTLPAYRPDWRDWSHVEALSALAERHLVAADIEVRPGRILLFRLHGAPWPRHCAIAVAPDRIVHAQERLGVVEAPLTLAWQRRIAGAWRFPFEN
jgi:NlpC/P60 family putative phage cell wall peptidase